MGPGRTEQIIQTKPLRILLSHVYAWPEVRRGGERYMHELGAALTAAGHHVTIATSSPAPGRDRILGVDVRLYPTRPWLRRYEQLQREAAFGLETLARWALRRFDVWHAFGTADAAAAAPLGRVRRVPGLRVRSVYTDLGNPVRSWRAPRPDADLHEYVVRNIESYLCLSEFSGDWLRHDYAREPIVVGGGVDLDRFAPAPARTSSPSLLFSGSVSEGRKNLPLLLDALARIRQRRPEVRLRVTGPGDAGPVLAAAPAAAREGTDVLGLGAVGDVERWYGEAWATVLPSQFEAFGLVLVESLACGTPVVTLDEGGPAELATPGVGFRAAGINAEDLAVACEAALDLAAAGPATTAACRAAAAHHDWRTGVVPKLEAVYRGQVGGRTATTVAAAMTSGTTTHGAAC
jgi:glycosyltransferase involved in cell wall biosynthesis